MFNQYWTQAVDYYASYFGWTRLSKHFEFIKKKNKHENPLQKCQKFYPTPPLKKEMVEGLIYKHVVKRPCASQKAWFYIFFPQN